MLLSLEVFRQFLSCLLTFRFDNADNGAQISSPVNIDPNSVFGDLSNDLGVLKHLVLRVFFKASDYI